MVAIYEEENSDELSISSGTLKDGQFTPESTGNVQIIESNMRDLFADIDVDRLNELRNEEKVVMSVYAYLGRRSAQLGVYMDYYEEIEEQLEGVMTFVSVRLDGDNYFTATYLDRGLLQMKAYLGGEEFVVDPEQVQARLYIVTLE